MPRKQVLNSALKKMTAVARSLGFLGRAKLEDGILNHYSSDHMMHDPSHGQMIPEPPFNAGPNSLSKPPHKNVKWKGIVQLLSVALQHDLESEEAGLFLVL